MAELTGAAAVSMRLLTREITPTVYLLLFPTRLLQLRCLCKDIRRQLLSFSNSVSTRHTPLQVCMAQCAAAMAICLSGSVVLDIRSGQPALAFVERRQNVR